MSRWERYWWCHRESADVLAALALIGWEWLISLCSAMYALEDQKQCAP